MTAPTPAAGDPVNAAAGTPPAGALLDRVLAAHPSAEDRPQQRRMVDLVAESVASQVPLIVQASPGTGKSVGYLCGALPTDRRVVVSTATKQLGEQLSGKDAPLVLAHLTGAKTVALLKGRANYICLARVDEITRLGQADDDAPDQETIDGLDLADPRRPSPQDLRTLQSVLTWADDTTTGDRTDAPDATDWAWQQVSVSAAECVCASLCPHAAGCFAEKARAAARTADLVITNHALLASDLASPSPVVDDNAVIIVDEVHDLENYLSSAWGRTLSPHAAARDVAKAARRAPTGEQNVRDRARSLVEDLQALPDLLADVPAGPAPALPDPVTALLRTATDKAGLLASELARLADKADKAAGLRIRSAAHEIADLHVTLDTVLSSDPAHTVRWLEPDFRSGDPAVRTAPLHVGDLLRNYLGDRHLIATSATASIAGDFAPLARSLGLQNPDGTDVRDWTGEDVGTPFDYARQAMLYVPAAPFPEPVGRDRADHHTAVHDETVRLVTAAGGRALILTTTTAAAVNVAATLRARLPRTITVLAHGDTTPAALVHRFRDDETSVLCATMGMWAGVDVPGPSLSLVIIDKIPFAPMNDPLMAARRTAADADGRNGFTDVFVTAASLLLTQAVGRLIRTTSDRGVVAVLDRRLLTKGYGALMRRSLPPMGLFHDRDVVTAALNRLAATHDTSRPGRGAA